MEINLCCCVLCGLKDYEVIVNQKDFPEVKIGDILEIFHPDNEEQSHLLLQIKAFQDDFTQNNTISVATAVAKIFNLKNYQDVNVSVVNPKDVALDLVELNFKEQYLSRSDMWRLRKSLINSVVYLGKSTSFAQIRVSVQELWSKGDQVTCGYINEDTRVTFRSSTAQVNIFIQMSCEMWDFDNYGDLYFEKTVQGFLVDLFSHWKEKNCGHDVTITMFSRTFYEAKSIEEFPMYMRECIQRDYEGRFYEDFYRVVIQNERYDEWTNTIIQLKTLFNQYLDGVLRYHERPGYKIPSARNSTAAEGNFLEVLNMGLNIYEKFYLDRNFDRTGKLSITITPGPGVFEVDRELTHITKQRTIDCGNSCDLVCMGEQPLHVTPLFKFHSKNPINSPGVGDDYNIPHWINHSFYMSSSQEEKLSKHQFIPRIRMPECAVKWKTDIQMEDTGFSSTANDMPFVDYDEYDAQVFKVSKYKKSTPFHSFGTKSVGCTQESMIKRTRRYPYTEKFESTQVSGSTSPSHALSISPSKKEQEEFMPNSYSGHEKPFDYETVYFRRQVAGSCGSPEGHHSKHSLFNYRPSRALINPFAPSRLHFKVTSNRRRWVHAFPRDWQGATVQPHHQHSNSICMSDIQQERISPPTKEVQQAAQKAIEMRKQQSHKQSECSTDGTEDILPHYTGSGRAKKVSMTVSSSSDSGGEGVMSRDNSAGLLHKGVRPMSSGNNIVTLSGASREHLYSDSSSILDREPYNGPTLSTSSGRSRTINMMYSRSSSVHKEMLLDMSKEVDHNWMFGVTGEQEWTPEIQTGMDWKSMTRPASLPVTTDYFPDHRILQHSYYFNPYTVIADLLSSEASPYSTRKPLTTKQVYNELVYQRIAQGFQIVLLPKHSHTVDTLPSISSSPYQGGSLRRKAKIDAAEEMILSIGRIFHKLALSGSEIQVTRIWPRHPYPEKHYHYAYRFQVPDSETYDVSWTDFKNEKLENFNWNYVDQYICTKGEEDDFQLVTTDKYWRARFFLLPCNNAPTKKIVEGAERCDIYEERGHGEQKLLCEGFLRFLEAINKIRRPPPSRMPKSTDRDLKRRLSMPISPMAGSLSGGDKVGEHTPGSRAISKVLDFAESSPQNQSGNVLGIGSPITNVRLDGSLNLPQISGSPSEVCKLSQASPLSEIVEAMMDANEGVNFLNKQQGTNMQPLPSNCFVSAEGVNWIQTRVKDVADTQQALSLLQRMTDENMIRHASGNKRKKYLYGFYLYCIIYEKEKKETGSFLHLTSEYYDCLNFQSEWCEVEIHCCQNDYQESVPVFLSPQLPKVNLTNNDENSASRHKKDSRKKQAFHAGIKNWRSIDDPLLQIKLSALKHDRGEIKTVYVDVDSNHLSDRIEWGIAGYHAHYSPLSAFELELEWLVATGCILGELVQGWARKAGQWGFHLLPVPGDPFALPFTPNSDPLRGPIFVPLNVDCLKEDGSQIFEDFLPNSKEDRMLLLKDSILKRFGFVPDKFVPDQPLPSSNDSAPPTYIHCSGGMFAMIPDNKTTSPRNRDGTHCNLSGLTPPSLSVTPSSQASSISGSHLTNQDYTANCMIQHSTSSTLIRPSSATVQCSGYYQEGFLWSWNFMLTKKWRSNNTGDEHFQDKMLADFREFCANKNNRLKDYFQSCKHNAINGDNDVDMEDVLTVVDDSKSTDACNLQSINES